MEIFVLMAQHPEIKGIRATTIRSLRAHRHLIDDAFRSDLAVTSLFMELLRTPHALDQTLSAMKKYNVLGRYLPEFGQIIGQMQHDLFHIYTVDAHTMRVIRNMVRLDSADARNEYPLASRLIHRLTLQTYLWAQYKQVGLSPTLYALMTLLILVRLLVMLLLVLKARGGTSSAAAESR